jgi:DNA-binding LacI/PurR family transcriptional regulator
MQNADAFLRFGDAPVSMKSTRLEDVARLAGVSISTASRALNDSPSVNQRTKQVIWKLARELDYPFRSTMPAGPIGAEATIALVVPRPQARDTGRSDPFLHELIAGVASAARERGCDVLMSHISPASVADLSAAMTTSRAEGVIFLGQSSLHQAFNALGDLHANFVVWGAELPDQTYCSVGSDNPSGARRATLHLARLGRKRIAFLGDTEAVEAMQRYRGYLAALEEFGLTPDPDLVVPVHFEVESAATAVHAMLEGGRRFDGVIAASDLIAFGVMRALRQAGLSVPGDVAVVGYDDVPYARFSTPALTTVGQDGAKAGRIMVAKLLDRVGRHGARPERLPTELIVRESCGA